MNLVLTWAEPIQSVILYEILNFFDRVAMFGTALRFAWTKRRRTIYQTT